MLRKRIIFTLIYSEDYFIQSRNFRLQKVGNLNWLEKNYKFHKIATSIDELIILNASRKEKNINNFANAITKVIDNVFIPIAAGGGINKIEDVEILFKSGADKIVLNTLLYQSPLIVKKIIKTFGSQSVVASIDCKSDVDNNYKIFIKDGSTKIDFNLVEYIKYLEDLGVGEIYLNSIDRDGTGFGYDLHLVNKVTKLTNLPIIIAGGAGNAIHLIEGLNIKNVSAVATANLFNFIGDGLPNARLEIIESNQNISNWNTNNDI
jgi:cyclase